MQRLLVRFQSAGLYLRGNSPNEINDAHARGKVIVALQATRTRRSGSQGEPLGPCRLMEKPGGYDPSVARSSRVGDIQNGGCGRMVMQRPVEPSNAGSNPVSHLKKKILRSRLERRQPSPISCVMQVRILSPLL